MGLVSCYLGKEFYLHVTADLDFVFCKDKSYSNFR